MKEKNVKVNLPLIWLAVIAMIIPIVIGVIGSETLPDGFRYVGLISQICAIALVLINIFCNRGIKWDLKKDSLWAGILCFGAIINWVLCTMVCFTKSFEVVGVTLFGITLAFMTIKEALEPKEGKSPTVRLIIAIVVTVMILAVGFFAVKPVLW